MKAHSLVLLITITLLTVIGCGGGGGPVDPPTNNLMVQNIVGPTLLDEYSSGEFTIDASGDSGITYSWSIDQPLAGRYFNPHSKTTELQVAGVHQDTDITISVTVNSDNSAPVTKTLVVNVQDKITTAQNLWEVDFLNLSTPAINDHQYTFNYTGPTSGIQVGDMIVSSEGDGFLRKVEAIQDTGSSLTLATSQAELQEAFIAGTMETIIDFSGAHTSSTERTASDNHDGIYSYEYEDPIGLYLTEINLYQDLVPEEEIDQYKGVLYRDDKLEIRFIENSRLEYKPRIKIQVTVEGNEPVITLGDYGGDIILYLKLKATLFGDGPLYENHGAFDIPLPIGVPTKFEVELGPWKCWVGLKLTAGYDLTVGGEGWVTTGYQFIYNDYEFGGEFHPINNPLTEAMIYTHNVDGTIDEDIYLPTGDLHVDVDFIAYLRPEIGLDIPGWLTAKIDYEPYMRFHGDGEFYGLDDWCLEYSMYYGHKSAFYGTLLFWSGTTEILKDEWDLCDPQPCGSIGPCTPQGEPPTAAASASDYEIQVGEWVYFTDESTDPDGVDDIVKWEWDYSYNEVDGFNAEEVAQHTGHLFDTAGTFLVQLQVTDSAGHEDILNDPIVINVAGPVNLDPTAAASASDYEIQVGEWVYFTDESTDPDGVDDIVKWEWDYSYEEADGFISEEKAQHTAHKFEDEGTYIVQHRVTDSVGHEDMLNTPLQIVVQGPGSNDGNLIWAKRAGGASNESGFGITELSDNSIVVTGRFYGSATFGPDELNQTVLTSAGDYDIFIARYNPDGTLAWAKRAGGSSFEQGSGITVLSDNSTVVTGYFKEIATFGKGEPNQTELISAGPDDIFIARYNPDGTLAWAKRAGGSGSDCGNGATTLSDNSTVVVGNVGTTATFGEGEPNQTVLDANSADIFIARYNPDGTLAWAKCAGGCWYDVSDGVTALSDNSTVVVGGFMTTAVFGEGEPNQTILTSAGDWDIFIARYNPDGTLAWAKRAGGIWHENICGVTTLSDNSTVVTGGFAWTATFGEGEPNQTVLTAAGVSTDIFIARYNPDGTLLWAKRAGGEGPDRGHVITTLSDNSTFVTGKYGDPAIFGPGEPNETVLTSAGGEEIFIARYNTDGSLAWARHAGGEAYETSNGITTLSDNSIVLTGCFEESASFGPGEPSETVLTSAGGEDIFIARFSP